MYEKTFESIKMNKQSDLLSKNWFLISFNSLDTSLISGLRINRLHSYLMNKGINANLVTRQSHTNTLPSITIIPEKKLVARNRRFFNLIIPPDSSTIWAISVFRYLRKKKPGVILTTVPWFGIVFIGLFIRLFKSRHYWVVDFRDSWFSNPVYKPALFWYKKMVAFVLEYLTVKYADLIVLNTFKDQEIFLKRYPLLTGKSLVVRNGFDQLVKNQSREAGLGEPIRIVYSGTAYHRGIASIKIGEFLKKINNAGLSTICDYYGEYHPSIELSPFIDYKGSVSSDQIPKILSQYKLGLIYLQEACIGGGRVSQKFYDYLGSEVSPVVINPSEEMSKAIRSLNFGLEVYPNSPIEKTLKYLQNIHCSPSNSISADIIKPYTREFQFNEFYKYFSS